MNDPHEKRSEDQEEKVGPLIERGFLKVEQYQVNGEAELEKDECLEAWEELVTDDEQIKFDFF